MASHRPAFQFYPRDWIAHSGLAGCSLAAHGLWIRIMCLAHDAPVYGRLLNADCSPMSIKSLARRVGESPVHVKGLVDELLANGVGHRGADGALESPRMMRDEARRIVRAAGGALGGNPALKGATKDNVVVNLPVASKVNHAPTPAVAVAVVVASDASTASPENAEQRGRVTSGLPHQYLVDLDLVLKHVRVPATVIATLDAMHSGLHPPAYGWQEIGLGLHDLVANGEHERFNARQFRNYVKGARQQLAQQSTGSEPHARPDRKLTIGERVFLKASGGVS